MMNRAAWDANEFSGSDFFMIKHTFWSAHRLRQWNARESTQRSANATPAKIHS